LEADDLLDLDQDCNPGTLRIWILIATKLPLFQSPAAAKAALRTLVMKEPYLFTAITLQIYTAAGLEKYKFVFF